MTPKIKAGSTSVTIPLFIADTSSTTGGGLASLAHNTAGLVAEYRREGQNTYTAITLVAGTLGTWISGGFIADGSIPGRYELDLPDTVVASGARWVVVSLRGATNMLATHMVIELDAVDYQNATSFGLSRLDATVSSRSTLTAGDVWANATRTLSSFGFNVTVDVNNDKTGYSLTVSPPTADTIAGEVLKKKVEDVIGSLGLSDDHTLAFLIMAITEWARTNTGVMVKKPDGTDWKEKTITVSNTLTPVATVT